MGDNYSTNLEVKIRKGEEVNAIKALREWILKTEEGNGASFSLKGKYDRRLYSFDGLMKIIFADDNQPMDIGWDVGEVGERVVATLREDSRGFVKYANCFSCSYGWQGVMWEAFDILAPFCEDGTSLLIAADEGWLEREVTDGNVEDVDKGTREDEEDED